MPMSSACLFFRACATYHVGICGESIEEASRMNVHGPDTMTIYILHILLYDVRKLFDIGPSTCFMKTNKLPHESVDATCFMMIHERFCFKGCPWAFVYECS